MAPRNIPSGFSARQVVDPVEAQVADGEVEGPVGERQQLLVARDAQPLR
jgi:hypothetical protein